MKRRVPDPHACIAIVTVFVWVEWYSFSQSQAHRRKYLIAYQCVTCAQGVRGISDIITVPGLVNVDFADVSAIMSGAGSSLMGQVNCSQVLCARFLRAVWFWV